jgi:hypothetical protein
MIDKVKVRKKKDEEINYMLSEPLQKAWTTFDPMLVHVIQLLQYGLHTWCPIWFFKLLKIWFYFHHVRVQIKHGIVPLLIDDIMHTCSPKTCIIPLKIDSSLNGASLTTWYRIVGTFTLLACEKYMLEKFVITLHVNASAIHPSTLALLRTIYLSFLILFLDYTFTWTA